MLTQPTISDLPIDTPDRPDTKWLLLRDLQGARSDFDRAWERIPPQEAAALYHHRGGVRAQQNDFAGAVADYDQALRLDPRFWRAHVSRGNARYHLRDFRAIADYRKAFFLNAEGTARDLSRMIRQAAARNPEAVLDNCDNHLRICERDAIAHACRGLTLVVLGREEEAAPHLERFLALVGGAHEYLDLLLSFARGWRREPAAIEAA